jgi:flagellar hook-length control protein FliK
MPVASNPLLQPASVTQTSATSALLSSKTPDVAPTGADSFASVYSRQSQADYAQKADAAQAYSDKLANAAANKSSFADQPDPSKPVVADSGKDLPAKAKPAADDNKVDSTKVDSTKVDSNKVDSTKGNDKKVASKDKDSDQDGTAKADDAKASKSDKADKTAASDDAKADDALAKATDPAVDPTALLKPAVDPTAAAATAPAAAATPAVDPNLLAMVAPPATAAKDALKDASKSDDDFDPNADPLADMPALRLALEQNAKAQGTTSAHAADNNQAANGTQQADDSAAAAGLTTLIQQQAATEGKAGSGDKGLGAATTEDGVKGIKGGIGDASASTFGDRLSALTQATGKSVSSAPATPPASPLAMNQSGWTEGVVNRVMYLSSQNLKSADIQLSPAELGRLDIKVTMNSDQQTQVTFMSAHVGVREALENQQGRLKDMFAQQGLGQMDVNVSDQSRQQQQNSQSQAQQTSGGSGGRLGRSDGVDSDSAGSDVAQVIHSTSVIGTSAVDYYA